MRPKTKKEHIIPALERAIGYLESLGESDMGMTQPELCERLGISASTCYRITQTLLKKGWVFKRSKTLYDIAPGILAVTNKLNNYKKRFESSKPVLHQLSAATGLASKLSIRHGMQQFTVLRAESPKPMAINGKTGVHFPLIEGSVGAALLSGYEYSDVIDIVEECSEHIEEKDRPEHLFKRLKQVKEHGYVIADHTRWNVTAMSVPVLSQSGEVEAALTLLGFSNDFEDEKEIERFFKLLKNAADSLRLQ